MQRKLLLFDVDGTLTESSKKIDAEMLDILHQLKGESIDLGVVGGGTFAKIQSQLDFFPFDYFFSDCGSTFHLKNKTTGEYEFQYQNILLEHELYMSMTPLIRKSLLFIVDHLNNVSGHFIDVRSGLIYISLIGLQATDEQREQFILEDVEANYRQLLLDELKEEAKKLHIGDKIRITLGGNTGIAIYPTEWDKVQVLKHIPIQNYHRIFYFGDRYTPDGNDYRIIHHPQIIGIPVQRPRETKLLLRAEFL